jgi:hypothetical protein
MNELVSEFISQQFTPEAVEDFKRAFELFNAFNSLDDDEKLIDILTDSNLTSIDQKDAIYKAVNDSADKILSAHTIRTYDDVSLAVKNEMMSALFLVQHLEDSKPFQIALESPENDDEILAFIISELSTLDKLDVMSAIADFRPSVLKQLKAYLLSKETEDTTPVVDKYIKTLKEFKAFSKKDDLIGLQLTESGMLLGQRLETYAGYISNIEVRDLDTLSYHILSLLYMTPEGINSPILAYRRSSHVLFDDLAVVSNVENKLASLVANFNEYQKALNEKIRLSETGS